MSDNLLPCPFCGGIPKLDVKVQCFGHGQYHKVYFIACTLCGCRTDDEVVYFKTPHQCEIDSIKNWNTRKESD